MPSSEADEARRERFGWLRSQGLGVICGLSTVFLLAVGSFVVAFTRKGASAHVRMDDLRAFFEHPSPWHAWLYLLIPIMGLYAINTLYATLHNVVDKWRAGHRSPFRFGAAVIHVAFVIALFAHLVGGVWSEERGVVMVDASWTELDDGRRLRLDRVVTDAYPNGQLRRVDAHIDVASSSGDVHREVVAFNAPLSSGWGSDLLLLASWGPQPIAQLSAAGVTCRATVRQPCAFAGQTVHLRGVREFGRMRTLVALLSLARPDGSLSEPFLVAPQHAYRLPDGADMRLDRIESSETVVLRRRRAAGTPIALASALLLLLGLGLLGRRWIQ